MSEPENIDDLNAFYAHDDGVYSDDVDYYECDYPDEKKGERSENTIIVDELDGIDFSSISGDFNSSLKRVTKQAAKNQEKINKVIAPADRTVIVEGASNHYEQSFFEKHPSATSNYSKKKVKRKKVVNSLKLAKDWDVQKRATIYSENERSTNKIIVPRDRKVIVEGINKFILSDDCNANDLKSIGYCNGKKLKEMLFTINNEGHLDYTVEFFNPSQPLDYYQSTSQNINDKIIVAGSNVDHVQYTDVLFHMMSNPTKIINSKVVITAPDETTLFNQRAINFRNTQKDLRAWEDIRSINIDLMLDAFQFQSNIVAYNLEKELGRPYVPDGMDILKYTVLAGCTVSIAFYYEQKMLKKFFYEETRDNKLIL